MQPWIDSQSTSVGPTPTILDMRKATTPAQYRTKFIGRTKAARTLSGYNPREIAELMAVPKDTYHRYETRVLLPHHLIQQFCTLCGVEIDWLITGARRSAERQNEIPGDPSRARAVA